MDSYMQGTNDINSWKYCCNHAYLLSLIIERYVELVITCTKLPLGLGNFVMSNHWKNLTKCRDFPAYLKFLSLCQLLKTNYMC